MAAHRGGLSYLARRARIILLAAQGKSNREIHVLTGSSYQTVEVWRRRFSRGRLAGFECLSRAGVATRSKGKRR